MKRDKKFQKEKRYKIPIARTKPKDRSSALNLEMYVNLKNPKIFFDYELLYCKFHDPSETIIYTPRVRGYLDTLKN